jgi:hypothetical protein
MLCLISYRFCFQGGAQFPTGGIVHERKLIRCDSETDGIVRMKENCDAGFICPAFLQGFFMPHRIQKEQEK